MDFSFLLRSSKNIYFNENGRGRKVVTGLINDRHNIDEFFVWKHTYMHTKRKVLINLNIELLLITTTYNFEHVILFNIECS